MNSEPRAVRRDVALTFIALTAAIATGVDWLGQPLRLVHFLTILGLGMSAGVSWAQAVVHLKHRGKPSPSGRAVIES
jgi:hypothetical protein